MNNETKEEETNSAMIMSYIMSTELLHIMDSFSETSIYKQKIKMRGNAFLKELDAFVGKACEEFQDPELSETYSNIQIAFSKHIDEFKF